MKPFKIESGIPIPKVNHDFMKKYEKRLTQHFLRMQHGDRIILPFHYCSIKPLCDKLGINVVARQLSASSWSFWTILKEFKRGDTAIIRESQFSPIPLNSPCTILGVKDGGYEVEVKNGDNTYIIFVEKTHLK